MDQEGKTEQEKHTSIHNQNQIAMHVKRLLQRRKQHWRWRGERTREEERRKKGGMMKGREEQEGAGSYELREIKSNLSPPLAISITFTTLIPTRPRSSLPSTRPHHTDYFNPALKTSLYWPVLRWWSCGGVLCWAVLRCGWCGGGGECV